MVLRIFQSFSTEHLWFLFRKLSPKIRKIIFFILILLFFAVLAFGLTVKGDFLNVICFSPIVVSLLASPFWCFTVYLLMSIYAYRQSRESRLTLALKYRIIIGFGAILTYASAWWFSIQLMLTEYAKLPTEPPDCYIATAAAKGHRHFVQSEDVVLADGQIMRVNAQLRYLKCGELMIKALFPKLHRFMRKMYDTVGPLLARCLVRSVLADITYILLKPAEWFVFGMLFVLFGRKRDIVEKFYSH